MVAMSLAVRWSASEGIWSNPKSLEFLAALSTLILIAGAVIEEWPQLKRIGLLTAKMLMFRSTAFERCVLKRLVTHSTGAILVVVGIVGELVFETRMFVVEDSQTSAATLKIGILDVKAKELEQGNLGIQQQIAEAQRETAESKKEAESERLERTKLEAIVAPRSLRLDQQKRIADACHSFADHAVKVGSYGMDGEGAALATQIMSALQSANITVSDARGSTMVAGEFDVGIQVRDWQISEAKFAACLVDALSRIGNLQVSLNQPWPKLGATMFGGGKQGFPAGTSYVDVMIGIKPLPVLPSTK
jgi:hypothetical protein